MASKSPRGDIELTQERLLEIVTPKQVSNNPLMKVRLGKDTYRLRKEILSQKLQHLMDILKVNHWPALQRSVSDAPKTCLGDPMKFVFYLQQKSDRSSELLYEYVLKLCSLRRELIELENRVEDSIEYDELLY